mmetsp:Transcript_8748/g.13535  ORF Transcript_8748/g.13535 Transcript_8748/m.13535 type:complete len:87 (-) Transcript_8748:26-286(-)
MNRMFHGADACNQRIGSWDVSSVTDTERMFNLAGAFNQPIGSTSIFRNTDLFHPNLCEWGPKLPITASMLNSFLSCPITVDPPRWA